MPLKTDYASGDTLPAADLNTANTQINANEAEIATLPLAVPLPSAMLSTFGGSDDAGYICMCSDTPFYIIKTDGSEMQERDISADWAAGSIMGGCCILGGYMYLIVWNEIAEQRIYRYDMTNLAAGGTQMTIAGTALHTGEPKYIITDGTDLFIHDDNLNKHVYKRAVVLGTTLTLDAAVTCAAGNVSFSYGAFTDGIKYYGAANTGFIKRHDMAGTLEATKPLVNSATCKTVLLGTQHKTLATISGMGLINPRDLAFLAL